MDHAKPAPSSRRERILAAAIEAFAARGFEGTSMRQIAEAAGATVPLLFYHFRAKADLYLAAVLDQLEKLRAGLDTALGPQHNAYERLRTFVEVYVSYFVEHEPGLSVTLRELGGLPADISVAISRRYEQQILARLEEILSTGVKEGSFRPLNVVACAFTIIGILHGFIRAGVGNNGRFTPADATEQVLGYYSASLLVRAEASYGAADTNGETVLYEGQTAAPDPQR